jgi:glyoxylase-like metal-dependent hydrolase (beta-lactamase superfamily II)
MVPDMSSASASTAHAVSSDSGQPWTAEGAWEVADGIYRIPLPLPLDGLKAVNVYVITGDDGLVLIDGGWAIDVARAVLERSLGQLGAGLGDISSFLVTHVHRDHYTMAAVLGTEFDAEVTLGVGERPALRLLGDGHGTNLQSLLSGLISAGALELIDRWSGAAGDTHDSKMWRLPDRWLEGDHVVGVGARTLDAVHTPGHTPGHYVFVARAEGLLFAGDHVLPTITPSIGFTTPPPMNPLGDFMTSLAKVRSMPDLRILPAHGPVAPSSHARVDELLAHHEHRLAECLSALASGPATGFEIAHKLGWTRHQRSFDELDLFNQGLAAGETKAHLELLAARALATRASRADGAVLFAGLADDSGTGGGSTELGPSETV